MTQTAHAFHAVVAGYGLPGRAAAARLLDAGGSVAVIELNGQTVRRCTGDTERPIRFVCGDAADESCLREAGIESATWLVLSLPDDEATLRAIDESRRLNPRLRIHARTRYTSTGLEATRRGAEGVTVAEQVVAREIEAAISAAIGLADAGSRLPGP